MTLAQRKVGDVVADDYRLGATFKQFGIDFCCGGGITVEAACQKNGVDLDELARAIAGASQQRSAGAQLDARSWSPDFLADYIVNVHHRYVRENIPVLLQFSQKVARVHGDARPELLDIASTFQELAAEMQAHLLEEEQELFPYIKELTEAKSEDGRDTGRGFESVQEPIAARVHEHESAGGLMLNLRTLSDDFTPPEWACNTYCALFAKLEEFEEDLHRHVHLENNILFPAAVELEQELTAA